MKRSRSDKIARAILVIMIMSLMVIGVWTAYESFISNRSIFDTTYTFEEAVVAMPDGTVIRGEVSRWTDFEDGDQIQVTINGKTYLTHSINVVLISE